MNSATINLEGKTQDFLLDKKDFKTGSRGYHSQGKMEVDGKRYQVNLLFVEIGSNPNAKKK